MKEEGLEALRNVYYIIVAGHGIEIAVPENCDTALCLPTFSAFMVDAVEESKIVMKVDLFEGEAPYNEEKGKVLTDMSLAWKNRFSFEELREGYRVFIGTEKKKDDWCMHTNRDFSKVKIYFVEDELYTSSILTWCLMMAYGQAILKKESVMIHASVVERNGAAYAFLGKSGTGKSTHSQLWLEHIEGTRLLNDDNPILRVEEDGNVRIYGTPWSGKTPCYINEGADLKALVRLQQAGYNRMQWLDSLASLVVLMPSCTAIRWNMELFNSMIGTVEKVVRQVKVGKLDCLPNRDAAIVSYQEMMKSQWE